MSGIVWSGEPPAWEEISRLNPDEVRQRAKVGYDPASVTYALPIFGETILVKVALRELSGASNLSRQMVEELGYYSRMAVLHYLLHAKDMPLTGELAKPYNASAGQIYFSGTHQLPLAELAARYGDSPEEFIRRGVMLGGVRLTHGDASLRLYPFPQVPVTLILWRGDEEFPPRADLLFDASCLRVFPPDILWATAMLTLLVMMTG